MHELSVTQGILKICQDEAKDKKFKQIKEIRIKVGELTGLVPHCIEYYFEIISKDTIADGAKLKIDKLPIVISCRDCSFDGEIDREQYRCPKCNSNRIQIQNGREFYVDSLEVE